MFVRIEFRPERFTDAMQPWITESRLFSPDHPADDVGHEVPNALSEHVHSQVVAKLQQGYDSAHRHCPAVKQPAMHADREVKGDGISNAE